ncbi:MAG: hypothetical protein H7Z14_08495 [Anaerolineae bacterium]|nr:hypothetical protein [Phycisphaerae bacterium]
MISTLAFVSLLAQSSSTSTTYRPFITPLPVWDYWILLLIPLCLGVSIVYKAIRVQSINEVPKQALIITAWILGGMAAAAAVLAVIIRVL